MVRINAGWTARFKTNAATFHYAHLRTAEQLAIQLLGLGVVQYYLGE